MIIKRVLVISYILAAVVLSIYSTSAETQPALFWIDLFAPDYGDSYNIKLVILLTLLMLLIPLIILLLIMIFFQNSTNKSRVPVSPHETGIWIKRKKQLQSALVPAAIMINNIKVGSVNMGQSTFFSTSTNSIIIQAGEGKTQSLPFSYTLQQGQQLILDLESAQDGLFAKFVLTESV